MWLFIGKNLVARTLWVTLLLSVALDAFAFMPDYTGDKILASLFCGLLQGTGLGMIMITGATSGGTDIVAMLLKKYTTMEIGTAIFAVDLLITLSAFFIFDFATGLYSLTGLFAKTLIMDGAIENMNLCKYFTIITTNPKPICDFIHHELNRSATIYKAEGAYSHTETNIVLVVLKRSQAVRLRRFIKEVEPNAFMMITNSTEIIGKGFRGFN
jgi:uncharacterized membrane-anchored protein YitT (DUF2179 family)